MSPRQKLAAFAALALLWLAAPGAAGAVVLGSPDYVPSYGEGWGTSMPTTISNGGAPSGVVTAISWQGWGEPVATASASTSIYKPQGGYYAARPRIPLRVSDVGACPGQSEPAYRLLEFRLPPWPGGPLGPWLKWSGSLNLCDYSVKDPAYEYPQRPPGQCGNIGDDYEPDDILDVTTFELGCREGRAVAKRAERKVRRTFPRKCFDAGCSRQVADFHCRWYPLRSGETTIAIDYPYPVQRVACSRGEATITWRFVLSYD